MCELGCGITALNSNLMFIGKTCFHNSTLELVFFHNAAAEFGGAIYTEDNIVLTFNGTNIFIKNSAELGGTIDAFDNAEFTFNGTNIFTNNSAHYGGGAICTEYDGVFTFSGTSKVINNLANMQT